MKKNHAVSILVPAYNAGKYISECLESIVNQTLSDIEIIVLDDGSTDNTGAIVKMYAEKDHRITVIHQDNSGIIKARKKLLEIASGEYVGFVDADDFIKPDMYEKMYRAAISQDADMVMCDYAFYPKKNRKKRKWYTPYSGQVDSRFLDSNNQHWNKIVKRELIEKYEIAKWHETCGEGAYTLVLLFAKRIVSINEELYFYRLGHNSISSNWNNVKWFEENIKKSIRMKELIDYYGLNEKWGDLYLSKISFCYIQGMIVAAYNNKKSIYMRMRKENKEYKQYNKILKKNVDEDFGKTKSLVMRKVIPSSYYLAKWISKAALNI